MYPARFVKEKSQELHGFDEEKLAAYMIGRWKNGMLTIPLYPRLSVLGQRKANRLIICRVPC